MSKVEITVRHSLDPAEVMRKIRVEYEVRKVEYARIVKILKEDWDWSTNTVTITARVLNVKTVAGTVRCYADRVEAVSDIPDYINCLFEKNLRPWAENRLREFLT